MRGLLLRAAGGETADARLLSRERRRLPAPAMNAPLRTGLIVLGTVVGLATIGVVALPDPNEQSLDQAFAGPLTAGHPLGADTLGRDLLSWCAHGVFTSLQVSLVVAAIAAVLGTAVGLAAGFRGGLLDSVLMRVVDLSLAIPPLLLFISFSVVMTASRSSLILLLSFVAWVPYARIVRAQVQSEREREYVAAARLTGTSQIGLCLRHLLPAVSTAIVILFTLQLGYVLLWEAGLSFLGLGIQPPQASLGYMIAEGRDYLQTAWWISVVPGVVIVLLMTSFNLIGDGLRDRLQHDEVAA